MLFGGYNVSIPTGTEKQGTRPFLQVGPLGVCHAGHLPGLVPQTPAILHFLLLPLSKLPAYCRGPGVPLGEVAWYLCSGVNQKQVTLLVSG